MINAKAVLIRELETPFWNAKKKVRSDKRLSQKHISVELINAELFWMYISDRPTRRVPYMISALRVKLRNAAAQWQGLPLESRTRTHDRVRW